MKELLLNTTYLFRKGIFEGFVRKLNIFIGTIHLFFFFTKKP